MSMIKALYMHTEMRVMINGCLSSQYKVVRGVRQGDLMSCILFDLAIKPLAARLRESHLKGYEIQGNEEKIIANLFADDTTVFLSENDDFEDLQNILHKWYQALTAKFSIQNTEIIPIGTKDYRGRVITARKTHDDRARPISNNMRIVRDGEAVRILGAWVGNEIENEGV